MRPFTTATGIGAPMPAANIDTDQIVPKQFLKTISREGLGRALFYDQRFDARGVPITGFVLDTAPWDRAIVLVCGDNFGCGSSREHAPWALIDFGIRAMVGTSFADIFYNNSLNNGLLPVTLSEAQVAIAMAAAQAGEAVTVDLERCAVTAGGNVMSFAIDPDIRTRLLGGIDAIGDSLGHGEAIDAVERELEAAMPWIGNAKGSVPRYLR